MSTRLRSNRFVIVAPRMDDGFDVSLLPNAANGEIGGGMVISWNEAREIQLALECLLGPVPNWKKWTYRIKKTLRKNRNQANLA